MKKYRLFVLSLVFLFCTSLSFASEIDILVKKLVEKGILTEQEGKDMLSETRAEENKQYESQKTAVVEEVKCEISKSQDKLKDSILPSWVMAKHTNHIVRHTTWLSDICVLV